MLHRSFPNVPEPDKIHIELLASSSSSLRRVSLRRAAPAGGVLPAGLFLIAWRRPLQPPPEFFLPGAFSWLSSSASNRCRSSSTCVFLLLGFQFGFVSLPIPFGLSGLRQLFL
jgi:hypothetical protein